MTAGDLRDRVRWEKPARADDPESGQSKPTWVAVATRWANVKPLGGGEDVKHAQQVPARRYEVTIRSRTVAALAHDWNAVWTNRGNLVLKVLSVGPHPNGGEFVLVTCEERPASTTG